jgi:outer membrane protein TolC
MNRYLEYLLKLKLFVAFLLLLSNGYGQEISTISIESSLKIAGANNLTISKLNLNKTVLEADLLISKGWWIPEIFAGIQTRQLQGAAMNGNGSFFTDINQQNLWNGLGIDALWNIGEGIYKTKASELKLEANTYKTTTEKNIVLLEVADTYYQLLIGFLKANAYHQLHAVADNISQQLALQVGVGLAYESELLLAQSNVHHLKIQELNQQKYYYKKSTQLSRLLNLKPFNNLIPTDTILKPIELVNIDSLENLDSLGNNRAEIQEAKLLLKAISAEKLTTTKAFFIPNLRLNSFGSLYGGLLGPVSLMPSSPGSEIKQLYPTTSLNFSLQWKIPIEKIF